MENFTLGIQKWGGELEKVGGGLIIYYLFVMIVYTMLQSNTSSVLFSLSLCLCTILEMPSQDALRLAQMHNRVDTMHHNLTTADKVIM